MLTWTDLRLHVSHAFPRGSKSLNCDYQSDVGRRVTVEGRGDGILRYFGPLTHSVASGTYVGVELDKPTGK
jgi:hypothetical protein